MAPFWRYQFPAIAYAILIFILSSIPHGVPPVGIAYEDKWIHLIEYGAFGFFIARALWHQTRWTQGKKFFFFWAVVLGILYGISDEFHQYFVPGRFADYMDAFADAIGSLMGALVFRWYILRKGDLSASRKEGEIEKNPASE